MYCTYLFVYTNICYYALATCLFNLTDISEKSIYKLVVCVLCAMHRVRKVFCERILITLWMIFKVR